MLQVSAAGTTFTQSGWRAGSIRCVNKTSLVFKKMQTAKKEKKKGMCDQGRIAAQGRLSKRCGFNFPLPDGASNSGMDISGFLSLFLVNIQVILGWFKVPLVHSFMFLCRWQMLS